MNDMQEWTIQQQMVKIGRGSVNEIRISGPGVSQDHCQMSNYSGKLVLLNFCRNTWVDGIHLETGAYVELSEDCQLEVAIGMESFKFISVDER